MKPTDEQEQAALKRRWGKRTESTQADSVQRSVGRIRRRYTRVVKIGDKWNTYLQIDHQGFCVVEQTCRHRAQWFGKMLAVALERMLAANEKLRQRETEI
jgi:hypothetical protein